MIRSSITLLSFFSILAGCTSEKLEANDENAAGESGGGSGGSATGGTSSGGTSSGGKASGGTSGTSGGSGSSQGGSSTGGTNATGGTPECGGDAEVFEELTRGPIECEANSDCCVVVDSCVNEARVVRAGDEEAAQAAWPYCNDECTDCIPPAVVVGCRDGVCVGTEMDEEDFESPLRSTHCGTDDETMSEGTNMEFGCG